jgi:uncharacterized protein YeeX (DUF496 family)
MDFRDDNSIYEVKRRQDRERRTRLLADVWQPIYPATPLQDFYQIILKRTEDLHARLQKLESENAELRKRLGDE